MRDEVLNILLVEDDVIDVKNVQRAFEKLNIINPLAVASDGLQALEFLRGENGRKKIVPGLILMDINMPRMNGLELLRILRSDQELCLITVVVLTTSNEERDIVEAYQFNVAGYIVKPVMPEAFFEAMKVINKYWQLCERPSV